MANLKNGVRKYPKVDRKYGDIMGVKVSITSKEEVLTFIRSNLDVSDKFYIVSINPENLLIAASDRLLKKAIRRSDFSIPDGIGLAQAYKFLSFKHNKNNIFRLFIIFFQGLFVGAMTILNKKYLTDSLPIIKGRELFLDIISFSDTNHLKVYLFGGVEGESEKAKEVLEKTYKNVILKTNSEFPKYDKNAEPVSESDRIMHKAVVGSIKLFEPDLIFVGMNTPKQERWIYKNLFRLPNVVGAMSVGGSFNYIAGKMKIPPKWMENLGLEWIYRLIQEPRRLRRILNAFPIFPWKVFMWKLSPPKKVLTK